MPCPQLAGKAHRLASQLQRATETSSENVHSTVNSLQSYLLLNKNIQVGSFGDDDMDVRFLTLQRCAAGPLMHACS
jgi:hypothetical protein